MSAFLALLASCSVAEKAKTAHETAKTIFPKKEKNPYYLPNAENPLLKQDADLVIDIVRKGLNKKYYEHSKYLAIVDNYGLQDEFITLVDINGNKVYEASFKEEFPDLIKRLKSPGIKADVSVTTYYTSADSVIIKQDTIYSTSKI